MYSNSFLVLLVIVGGILGGFAVNAAASPKATLVGAPAVVQDHKNIPDGPPPLEEHKIDLAPFFLFQQKGPHVWLERVIVSFMTAAPKDSLKNDPDSPNFRKIIYELLLSGKPATSVQEQAVASLNRHLGMHLETMVQVSRSVIIVR